MQIKQATEARNRFQDVIDEVHYTKKPVIVSKRNKPWVIIQPLPDEVGEVDQLIKKEL